MSELAVKLLELINEGYMLNDISHELGISHQEIYKIFLDLKQIGMKFDKRYYEDGEMIYIPKKDLSYSTKKSSANIITSQSCEYIKLM